MLCFPSPFSSKGGSHASFVDRGLTTGIPTGCSRPPYLNRSSYRSLSPIASWKGSASEPYVKLPPHTAPLRIGNFRWLYERKFEEVFPRVFNMAVLVLEFKIVLYTNTQGFRFDVVYFHVLAFPEHLFFGNVCLLFEP